MTNWTDAAVERLKVLWRDEGRTASEVSEILSREFRVRIGRGAALGKIHRLGLQRDSPSSRGQVRQPKPAREERPKTPKPPKPEGRAPNVRVIANRQTYVEAEAEPPKVEFNARAFEPLPGVHPVPFGSPGCRWPVSGSGAEMSQCGSARAHDQNGLRPYCAVHWRAATVPLKAGQKGSEYARSLRRYTTQGRAAA